MIDPKGDAVVVAAGGEMHGQGCVLLAVGGIASISEDKDHVRAKMAEVSRVQTPLQRGRIWG